MPKTKNPNTKPFRVVVDGEIVKSFSNLKDAWWEASAYLGVEYGHLQDVEVIDREGFTVDPLGKRV